MSAKKPVLYPANTTLKYWKMLLESGKTMKHWTRLNRVLMGPLIRGMIKHYPDLWEAHKGSLGEIMVHNCPVCGFDFYANSKRHTICSSTCGDKKWPSHTVAGRKKAALERAEKAAQIASEDVTKDSKR